MPAPFLTTCSIYPFASPPPNGTPRSIGVPCRVVDLCKFPLVSLAQQVNQFLTHYVTLPGGTTVYDGSVPASGLLTETGSDIIVVGQHGLLILSVILVQDVLYGSPSWYRRVYCARQGSPYPVP